MPREFLNGANLKAALLLNGAAGTAGQILSSQGSGAPPQWVAAGGFTGGTLTSNLTLAAGTASVSPLTLQSGTNLTNATAGAVEYDGKVIYSTPGGRGVSPSMMYYRLNSSLAGSNVNTAQSVYGVGVTLLSGTVYEFDGFFVLQKTAGTNSHSIFIAYGGTATLNNIGYWGNSATVSSAPTAVSTSANVTGFSTAATGISFASSLTSASQTFIFKTHGTVSINAGGTFIPQYSLSSAPGGAYSTLAGSYFAIWPIGAAGANTSVGAWA